VNTLYDQACKAAIAVCVALAIVGLTFPATQAVIRAFLVLFVFFMIFGGLVFLTVAGIKLARWFDRLLG
jgi:hypothetical protein